MIYSESMRRTAILSHAADLDGCVSALNAYVAIKQKPTVYDITPEDVYFADYAESKDVLLNLIENYDNLFITDLSWKDESILDELPKEGKSFVFLDHHTDSKRVFDRLAKEFPNVHAKLADGGNYCAADLALEFVERGANVLYQLVAPDTRYTSEYMIGCLRSLTRYTHSRDLWILDEPLGDLLTKVIVVRDVPYLFNYLLEAITPSEDGEACQESIFDENYELIVPEEFLRYEEECQRTNVLAYAMAGNTRLSGELKLPNGESLWLHTMYSFGPVSEIGNDLMEQYKLGWAVILNVEKSSMSIRSNKETIDFIGIAANDLARMYGGGGHPPAAGAQLNLEQLRDINKVHNEIMTVLIQAIPRQLQALGRLQEKE